MLLAVFDPPIEFQYKHYSNYMNQPTVALSQAQGFDFMLGNPYRAACVASETNAVTLATLVVPDPSVIPLPNNNNNNNNTINDNNASAAAPKRQPISQYGAVLYTLKERQKDIASVADVRDKIVGTNLITRYDTDMRVLNHQQ